MKKRYTKKQITEAIAYWKNKLHESSSNPNLKFNPQLQKIVDGFAPTSEKICGMSIQQIMDGNLKNVAEQLLQRYAESVGKTGKRYVSGGGSHAGFDYDKMLDVRFTLTDVHAEQFDARIVLAYVKDVKYVPDGNPYDGVSPKYVDSNKIHKILFKFKPGFQLADLCKIDSMQAKEARLSLGKLDFFDLSEADIQKNGICPLLTWMLAPKDGEWRINKNFSKFMNYVAAPIVSQMLVKAQYADADEVKKITAKILSIPGLDAQLKAKDGSVDTDKLFMQQKARSHEKLEAKAHAKQLHAKAIETLKKLEAEGKTFEDVAELDDLSDIVCQLYGIDEIEEFCDPDEVIDDAELNARGQYFKHEEYVNDLWDILLSNLIDKMLDAANEPFNAEKFEQMESKIFNDPNVLNIVDVDDYIDDDGYYS